jgi:glutaredoxin
MVEVYSKDNCAYCTKAKILLETQHMEFIERKIGVDVTREQLLDSLSVSRSSLPRSNQKSRQG